jgi:hypothetical protein
LGDTSTEVGKLEIKSGVFLLILRKLG